MTPGAGSSITSTTTVWTSRPKDFIRCRFFRATPFTARLGLALATLRFVPRLCADFDALRVLRNFARFFACTLARFFRLAMIDLPPAAAYRGNLSVCAGGGSIK